MGNVYKKSPFQIVPTISGLHHKYKRIDMMMVIMMNDSKLSSMAQIKGFLQESGVIEFKKRSRKEAYYWIDETLRRFHYFILAKKEKGLIRSTSRR